MENLVTSQNLPWVILAVGICLFLWFAGIAIATNGWPKFGRK